MVDNSLYRKNDYNIHNYRRLELRSLTKLNKTVDKLDRSLKEVEKLNETQYDEYQFKKCIEHKKAMHEIQSAINQLNKYSKYANESFNQTQDSYSYLDAQVFN